MSWSAPKSNRPKHTRKRWPHNSKSSKTNTRRSAVAVAALWLRCAALCYAVLCCAVLCCAVLCCAVLCVGGLCVGVLSGVWLCGCVCGGE